MIVNNPSDKGKHIDDLRDAIEHRATWLYLLVEEARKRGLDHEFARDAIRACGTFHGQNKFSRTDDLRKFASEFANENVKAIFEMEVSANSEELNVEFHYCPLVAAWKKLTDDEDKVATLCDIAMDGDRGIAGEFPVFRFKLGKTIAKGDKICQVGFKKVK